MIVDKLCLFFDIILLENYIIEEEDFFNDSPLYDMFVSLNFDPISISFILNFLSSYSNVDFDFFLIVILGKFSGALSVVDLFNGIGWI